MYAVIKAGARQLKVSKGDQVKVDFVNGDVGKEVLFDKVLMVGGGKLVFGQPEVKGATVSAVITAQTHNDKVLVFKYKRRKNYKVLRGHRQPVTMVEIKDITVK